MRSLKVFICLLLVLCLSVLPFIQRVHAVVTVSTLVGVLILTVLAAMGITLVVKDIQKEAFVLQKGDSFIQSKGYSGSFAEWVAGGSDVDVALKTGFLVLAKPVVDRIKEFVAWLVPGAASDTIVDITSGSVYPTSAGFLVGSAAQVGSDVRFTSSSVLIPAYSVSSTYTDGLNNVSFVANGRGIIADGVYNSQTGEFRAIHPSIGPYSGTDIGLAFVSDGFVRNSVVYRPGIYVLAFPDSGNRYYGNLFYDNYFLDINSATSGTTIDASAVIGSYDDLSQLQDTTASDGTVNNTFYISTDGQALNPPSDDIADIIGALQQSLDDINRKLDVQPWTVEAAEAGTVKPDYTDFQLGDLDFSSLGALITTRFPFSIPWDMVRVFQLFVADPVAPKWEVDLLPIPAFEGVDTTVTLDFGQYPIVGQVSRWFCIIDLCLGLVFVSKKLIWTA